MPSEMEHSVSMHFGSWLEGTSFESQQDGVKPQDTGFYQAEDAYPYGVQISDDHFEGYNTTLGDTTRGWNPFDSKFPDICTLFRDEPAFVPSTMVANVNWEPPSYASDYTPFYSGREDQLRLVAGQSSMYLGAEELPFDIMPEPDWLESILGDDSATTQTHETMYDSQNHGSMGGQELSYSLATDDEILGQPHPQDGNFGAKSAPFGQIQHVQGPSQALHPAQLPDTGLQAPTFGPPAQMCDHLAQPQNYAGRQRPYTAAPCALPPQHMNMRRPRPQSAPRGSIMQPPYSVDYVQPAYQLPIAAAA